MSLFVGITTCDRPDLLEFCLRFMVAEGIPLDTEFFICDNSRNETFCDRPFVHELQHLAMVTVAPAYPLPEPNRSVRECDAELGQSRKLITDCFLASGHDCLLILDDDILVEMSTIVDAVRDLRLLQDSGVAAIGLHPFAKRFGNLRYHLGDRVFRTFDRTSDGCLLLARQSLEQVGNQFGSFPGGHADTQFDAFAKAGYTCATRIMPGYVVQHLGIDGLAGSRIYGKEKRKPGWVTRPFKNYLTNDVWYGEMLMLWRRVGIQTLLDHLREAATEDRNMNKRRQAADGFFKSRGHVDIEVQKLSGEVVRKIGVENLVVNNGKTIMSHLLAGDDTANYAITRMYFGTGTTAPVVTDTSLEVAITPVKALDSVDYPDTSSVRFTGDLESDEANGFAIAEAALYTIGHGMFARVTFGPLTKSSDFRFVFRWSVLW